MSLNSENDPWGWFEDVETDAHGSGHGGGDPSMSGQGTFLFLHIVPVQFLRRTTAIQFIIYIPPLCMLSYTSLSALAW
jgi:preprotein translocase subunit SecG